LLYHGIVPYELRPCERPAALERAFIGIVKVIWWTNAATLLISVVRVF
jgi:hypothetical protein